LNLVSIKLRKYFTEWRLEQIPDLRQRQARRHIAGRIDRDTVAPRIAGFQRFSTQPRHIVLRILSKIAGWQDILLE
jgi:hypothetical protein